VHLLAAMDHQRRAVLAQRQVGGAPEEVPAFAPLLAPLDLTGVVVTADALQTHPDAAEFLVGVKQAHYLLVVKANQPTLLDRCARLPSLPFELAAPPVWPTCCVGTGRLRRCTTSAMSPSPRTTRRSAAAPPQASWRPCGT
jgi:hypothetical protein